MGSLTGTRQYETEPHCPNGVGLKGLEVALTLYAFHQVVADGEERRAVNGDGVSYGHTLPFLRKKGRSAAKPEEQGCQERKCVSL